MKVSRRTLLAASAVGTLAALDPTGLLTRPGRAGTTGPAVTTLDRTVRPGPPGPLGYRKLVHGPGEPHLTRYDLVSVYSPLIDRPLIAFAQLSDLHIIDDQSPLRVEYLDRYAPEYPFSAAYRPQESMSTQLTDAMCRAIANVRNGPVTGLRLKHTLVTGDMIDNAQYNETRWYIDLLDGQSITPDSGSIGDQSFTGNTFGLSPRYWHPQHRQQELEGNQAAGLDDFFKVGFPEVPGFLAAVRRRFTSRGLGMPWYAAYGNHDRNVQGNADPGMLWAGSQMNDIAIGHRKPKGSSAELPPAKEDASLIDYANYFIYLTFAPDIASDWNRRLLSRAEFMQEHFRTSGFPRGHGFANVANDADYLIPPSGPEDLFQFICLDSTEGGSADGAVDPEQFDWLLAQLRACSSRFEVYDPHQQVFYPHHQPGVRDKLVILYCHHTLDSMDDHSALRLKLILLSHPNVIALVNGHTHNNTITPHRRPAGSNFPGGGFWEINTASHIDWPIQSRLIEVAEGEGTLAIYTTMVDIDAPLEPAGDLSTPAGVAALAREVAANDIQEVAKPGGVERRQGKPTDRNAKLLLPMPFQLPIRRSRLAMTRGSTGRMCVFAQNSAGAILKREQTTAGGAYGNWLQLNTPMQSIAAETNADGRIQLFAVGTDARIFHRSQTTAGGGWTNWLQLDGLLKSIAATRGSDGRIDLFGSNAEGTVWTRRQTTPGGAFGSWLQLGSGVMHAVAAETNADGSVVLLGINPWGRIYQRIRTSPTAAWSGWLPLTDPPAKLSSIAVCKQADNRLLLLGSDQLGRIMISTQTAAATWSPLSPMFTYAGDIHQPGFTMSVTAEVNSTGAVEVYALTDAGKLKSRTSGPSGTWSDWTPVPDLVPSPSTVPNLKGLTVTQARPMLEAQFLYVGTVGSVPVSEKPDGGKIQSHYPNAGTQVPSGSTVNLYVGLWDGSNH